VTRNARAFVIDVRFNRSATPFCDRVYAAVRSIRTLIFSSSLLSFTSSGVLSIRTAFRQCLISSSVVACLCQNAAYTSVRSLTRWIHNFHVKSSLIVNIYHRSPIVSTQYGPRKSMWTLLSGSIFVFCGYLADRLRALCCLTYFAVGNMLQTLWSFFYCSFCNQLYLSLS